MSADLATSELAVPLQDRFSRGLDAPICLTWELTYACNLACVHCLSSSGRRDPNELTPAEAIDAVVPDGQRESYRRALARLAASEVIDVR